MGLLKNAAVQDWDEAGEARKYIKKHGISQFINVYNLYKDRKLDELRWGDEIECMVVVVDHEQKKVRLSLSAPEIIDLFDRNSRNNRYSFEVKHEYGAYMLELTPLKPYSQYVDTLKTIERNMKERRLEIAKILNPNEHVLVMPHFPLLGVGDFLFPPPSSNNEASQSIYLSDDIISPFPRFKALTRNIRKRLGKKVHIEIPCFHDTQTPSDAPPIIMDAMGFGMGSCCLQVTFQASSLDESRVLYDQLAVVAPLVLALTANTPILLGRLADTDTRWSLISQSVDERTEQELHGPNPISKSRYDCVDLFIAQSPCVSEYNNTNVLIDQDAMTELLNAGVDEILAKHVAHLFIRDALVSYDDYASLDDMASSEHFENIQSSNWLSVRWKPPAFGSPIQAWRVELRTMEVMFTEYENAAFTAFVGLLSRAILFFGLKLYVPISLLDINMKRAQLRNAAVDQKFWFSNYAVPVGGYSCFKCCECSEDSMKERPCFEEYTLSQLMNGTKHFPGFVSLIDNYINMIGMGSESRALMTEYLSFISMRASGELYTGARWMREFVMSHPLYDHSGAVTQPIVYDLVNEILGISNGSKTAPKLLGTKIIDSVMDFSSSKDSERKVMVGDVFKSQRIPLMSLREFIEEAAKKHGIS